VSLCIPSSYRSPDHNPHRTIYYLGYPLGRFAGPKHRQLARQVGVIITTGRIRRTLVKKINLLVDSPRSIEASRLTPVKVESIFLRRASGCFGTSRGSSSTTSTTPRVRMPRHIVRLVTQLVALLVVDYSTSRRLVVDYFAYAARPGASARRAARRRLLGCVVDYLAASRGSLHGSSSHSSSTTPPFKGSSSTTSSMSRVRVPRHVTRLIVDYFDYTACPVASARRATRRTAHRRLLHLAQARCPLLRLRRASGCLGTSRGSSSGSSSTTSP
jgi:hypothetical protein